MKRYLPALVCWLFLVVPAAAGSTCDLAQTIAQRAWDSFQIDQAEGLPLFIKAQQLCIENPDYSYNLGVAYYQYGLLDDAITQMELAVSKKGEDSLWLSNLASLLIQQGGHADLALQYAEKSVRLDGGNPAAYETLARAQFAVGQQRNSLVGLFKVLKEYPDKRVEETYATLLDSYLAGQLEIIAAGQIDKGLAELKNLEFEPQAARTRALVLARADRGEEALEVASAALNKFSGNSDIEQLQNEVASQVALSLYEDFQSGTTGAVQRAKDLSEAYRADALKEAYERLLSALIKDAKTIDIPDVIARKSQVNQASSRTEQLLSTLGGSAVSTINIDLTVDVDENIPAGDSAGKYDVAVVIGNRSYRQAGVPAVDYAERDARVMNSYLTKTMGFDKDYIIYVENAGLADFNQIFGNSGDHRGKLNNYVVPGKSKVFIYYVGHGAPDLASGDAYFVPVDADPQYLRTSGYRLKTFYDNLAKIPATQITVVLDACFSGNSDKGLVFSGVSSLTMKVKENYRRPANVTVIASAQNDQVSTWYPEKRHSLFTYYFLKGLGGGADNDNDGKLTVAELETYLGDEVPRVARRLKGNEQQPSISGDRKHILAVLK